VGTIIPLFSRPAEPGPEFAVLRRMTRLDMATAEEMRAALALLCAVDPEAFEAALPAGLPDPGLEAAMEEPVAVCGRCGGIVALFPEDLTWRHCRGAAVVSGVQEVFDAGHAPLVEWYLPEEIPEELSV
jgi:hypothetical protein